MLGSLEVLLSSSEILLCTRAGFLELGLLLLFFFLFFFFFFLLELEDVELVFFVDLSMLTSVVRSVVDTEEAASVLKDDVDRPTTVNSVGIEEIRCGPILAGRD